MKQNIKINENTKSFLDIQVKNMIIRDLTHAYDHLPEKDSLMRFSIAKAILDLHLKYKNNDK
ncbi:MAG: hypothetical protein ACTSPY_14360 [Candidatus Helarchaeota archaeon]